MEKKVKLKRSIINKYLLGSTLPILLAILKEPFVKGIKGKSFPAFNNARQGNSVAFNKQSFEKLGDIQFAFDRCISRYDRFGRRQRINQFKIKPAYTCSRPPPMQVGRNWLQICRRS